MNLLNSLCYTIGWFWCVILGIHGHPIIAALGAIFLIVLQLYYAKSKDISLYIQDMLLVGFSIPLGALLELFFIQTNTIQYGQNAFPPIWIIAIYPLFALVLNHTLSFLKKSSFAAFLIGFFAAPFSYFGGSSLGGLTFEYSPYLTWIIIGTGWGLFLCLLIQIANSIEKAANETLEESKKPLELLYDGDCPLCKREICMLKKLDRQTKFIDIASKDFTHPKVDYKTAMAEMHAVDTQGNILKGIPAFAAVYARSQLLIASTLFRLPFVQSILRPFYNLFAKNRLWLTGRK